MEKIYIAGPSITEHEIDMVSEAVRNGWYDNAYVYVERFEQLFKDYVGRKYAIAMPSCTSSIHIALLALGIGAGDEVIVPDITWIATASPLNYLGAVPVFADIDKDSWCISLDSIKNLVTSKTKAIIFVDLFGNIPDVDGISTFAKERGIAVIEDAAQALGSEYKNAKAGSFGKISVFSFHGTKILTTGEGGMFLTDDEDIYKRALKFRDLGRSDSGKLFWNDFVGHKYKMSNIQAALGIAQLERFDEILAHKVNTFGWYFAALSGISGLRMNYVPEFSKSNYWMNTVMWDKNVYPIEKENLMRKMKDDYGIDTRPFFYPLSSMPAYAHFADMHYELANTVAYSLSPYSINLPSSMQVDERIAEYISVKFKLCLGC